jgi:hypothetical protein
MRTIQPIPISNAEGIIKLFLGSSCFFQHAKAWTPTTEAPLSD